jgi:hypothetical protein
MTLEMLLRIRSKLVGRENGVRLRDYLSVPYVLEAETVEISAGSWIRRVAYPELPGCAAESVVVEEALHLLERMRIEMIGLGRPAGRPCRRRHRPDRTRGRVDRAGNLTSVGCASRSQEKRREAKRE